MGLIAPDIERLKKGKKISELVQCLDHPRASIRYDAFIALAGNPDINEQIKNKLKNMMYRDPDSSVKTLATIRYAKLGDPEISDNLIQIIQEGSQKSKLELLRIITDSGASSDVTVLYIIQTGLNDDNVLVRLQAIKAANSSKNKQLMPDLGKLLHENHFKVRLMAAKALYNLDKYESAGYIIGLLADKNLEVQSTTRIYLLSIINDRAFYALNDDSSAYPDGAMDAGMLFHGETQRKSAKEIVNEGISILHGACNDKFRGVRVQALKSIAVFKSQTSIDIAEKLLYDKFPEVRLEALTTLEKIGGPRALAAIENKPRDKKKIVRDSIDRTLARMKKVQ